MKLSAGPSESFMGSKFTLGDLCVPGLDAFDFKMLSNSTTSSVIEMTPKKTGPGIAKPKEAVLKRKLQIQKPKYLVERIDYLNAANTNADKIRNRDLI